MRRLTTLAVAAIAIALVVAACGGGGDDAETVAAADTSGTSFDQLFIDAMVPHHEQAIEMAQAAKDAGLSEPDLVAIADDIVANQQGEIDQMLEWRAEWFGSDQVDPGAGEELGMSMEDMGMASDPSMLASGADVNAMFATMMLDHHNGAVQMAELALERADRPEIEELAQAIIDAQQAEMETLTKYADAGMEGMSGM